MSVHAMLDPQFFSRDHVSARALQRAALGMAQGDKQYNDHLNRILNPIERPQPLAENLEAARRYCVDVNAYIREVGQLLPAEMRKPLAMDPEVAVCNDVRGLMELTFESDHPRIRYEAQRKLYLAKLFFDIDHDPGVQLGPVHKAYFEEVLDGKLWSRATRAKPMDMYFSIAPDGLTMDMNTRRTDPAQEKWSFHLTRLKREKRRAIHVYHYACRFKREVAPFHYERGEAEYEVRERPIWETLHQRRSGSILSKMLRKGEVHPRKIQDIIGAMFIVKNVAEVEQLQDALFDIFGGPLRWKDRVNTIHYPEERARLNRHSARGYEVLKSDVDVLMAPSQEGRKPYLFSVEIQIYTVEGFLRTVHSRHYASHQQLKLRQFIQGLLPALYPESIYGPDLVERGLRGLVEDDAAGTHGPAPSSAG